MFLSGRASKKNVKWGTTKSFPDLKSFYLCSLPLIVENRLGSLSARISLESCTRVWNPVITGDIRFWSLHQLGENFTGSHNRSKQILKIINNVIPPSLDEANEIRLLLPTINGMGDFRLGVLHSCLIFSRRPSEHVEPRSRSMCASLSNARRRC